MGTNLKVLKRTEVGGVLVGTLRMHVNPRTFACVAVKEFTLSYCIRETCQFTIYIYTPIMET